MPNPDVIVAADAEALARAAAERILARLRQSSGRSADCFTGGSTLEHLYELLATNPTAMMPCPGIVGR
jgi:6-phosphogluconolactonase